VCVLFVVFGGHVHQFAHLEDTVLLPIRAASTCAHLEEALLLPLLEHGPHQLLLPRLAPAHRLPHLRRGGEAQGSPPLKGRPARH
jgi:hypothetical protein